MGSRSSPSSVSLSQSTCVLRLPPRASRKARTVVELLRHPKGAKHAQSLAFGGRSVDRGRSPLAGVARRRSAEVALRADLREALRL